MAKSRIAEAYVQLVPSATGFQAAISKELDGPIDNTVKATEGKFKQLGGILAGALAGAAVFNFAKDAITNASDLQESLNAVKVTFGDATGSIIALGENAAKSLGLSQTDFNALAVRFSAFATTIAGEGGNVASVVDQISKRGADFASVMNLDVNDALSKFQSGLAGETEPLRQFGIDLSAAAVEQYALANGIWDGTGAMTESQKVQARFGSLMEQTEKVTGDFANTSDGLANSQRIAGAQFADASAKLGEMLLPAIAGITSALADMLTWLNDNPVAMNILIGVVGLLAIAFIGLTVATWAMNTALLANPITWIVLGIVAAVALLIAIIVAIVTNWETIVAWLQDVFGPVFEWIGGIFTWLYETIIKPVFEGIAAVFTWIWETIINPIITAIGAIFQWLWDYILSPFFLAVGIYFAIWGAIFDWLWKNVIEPTINAIGALFTWLWENAIKPAIEAVGAIFEWLYNNIVKPVFDGISAVINWIYNNIIKPIFDNIGLAIKAMGIIFEWLYKNIIKPVFDNVASVFDWIWKSVIKPVVDFINKAIESVGKVVNDIFTGVSNFIRDTFNGLLGLIRGPINAVIDFINGVIGGINKIQITIPDWVPEWGGKTIGFNIPKIPKLAEGGYIDSATLAVIGEAGPEVVTPLKDFERMMGMDNGSGKTVNYYAAPNRSVDSEEALFQAMRRAKVVAGW